DGDHRRHGGPREGAHRHRAGDDRVLAVGAGPADLLRLLGQAVRVQGGAERRPLGAGGDRPGGLCGGGLLLPEAHQDDLVRRQRRDHRQAAAGGQRDRGGGRAVRLPAGDRGADLALPAGRQGRRGVRAGLGRVAHPPIEAYDELDSTNAEARRRAEAGEGGPVWITAALQTAGRGRRGRSWSTQRGNLAATLLMTTDKPPAEAAQLSFVAALAAADLADTCLGP